MANSEKKLVVILGATGAQGTPVIEYLLKHSSDIFNVRGVTRNPTGPKAQALASLGAEIVGADFDDETTMRNALQGARAIFCLTDFYDKMTIDSELIRGLRIARIASELPELEHFIFSALPDARSLFGGKFQVNLMYNAKTYVKEGMQRGYPALWEKTTVLYISFYYQNWMKTPLPFGPIRGEDGVFVQSMPYPGTAVVPSTSCIDSGAVVDAILKGGSKYHGKTVSLVTEHLTEEEKLKIWADTLGVKAVFKQVSPAEYEERLKEGGFPPTVALAVTELAQVMSGPENYVEAEGIVRGREAIDPNYELKSWVRYVKEEDWSSYP